MPPKISYCPQCGTNELDSINEGEFIRTKCSKCSWCFYDNPTPVVAAILTHAEKMVLIRNASWPKSFRGYGLITGFLERGEDPAEAIVREVKEELGLIVSIRRLVGVYGFKRLNQVIIVYHVECVDPGVDLEKEIVLQEEEVSAWKAIDISKVKPWGMGTGDGVRDFLKLVLGQKSKL